jgi:hypothetical protein
MAGTILQVVPKRVFDFGGLSTGGTQKLIVEQRIDISQYIDCMVALRVHAANVASGTTINFDVFGDGFTEEDPGVPFMTSSPLVSAQSITGSTGAQTLLTYGSTVRGHYAAVVATVNKVVAGTANATVSLDLVLRCPDDE